MNISLFVFNLLLMTLSGKVGTSTFSVARTSSLSSGKVPLPFDVDVTGSSINFNFSTNYYSVSKTGYYWIHISTGIPAGTQADLRLTSAYQQQDIVRAHGSYNTGVDTTSRDGLGLFNEGEKLSVTSIYGVYSDFFMQVSFSGFCLDDVSTETVTAIAAGRLYPLGVLGLITFDTVLLDTNNLWDSIDNAVVIKENGIYVFSFNTGANPGIGHTVSAMANTINVTSIYVTTTVHGAEDTLSKTFILSLNVNDRISFHLNRGQIYSDIRLLTSFAGFKYSPKIEGVSWSLFRSTIAIGPLDAVEFPTVLIDTAGSWNTTTSKYTVSATGLYFIHLNAGANVNQEFEMALNVNEINKFTLIRTFVTHNGYDTKGRSLIVSLNQNDKLRIAIGAGTSLYSDSSLITSFSGFRLQ